MKKFVFALERVSEWRQLQIAMESAKLEKLTAALRAVVQRAEALEREQDRNESAVIRADWTDAQALGALHEFRKYTRVQQELLRQQRADGERQVLAQRESLLEARRNARLLDQLKQRRQRVWQTGFDKELEEQAAEAYLARWKPGDQRSSGGRLP